MSVLNTESWSATEVADWISGLDSNLSLYSSKFLDQNVNGHLLLNLMPGDLFKYGVDKIGDQLLLRDAILTLRNELEMDRTTLQTLSSSLAIRCRNYRSELSLTKPLQSNYIPTESLSSASYLLDSAKILIRWLTRFPFIGSPHYDAITVALTKHSFELAMLSQRDSFADNAIEEVQYLCTKIIEICEGIIHSKDSLIIQPAAVDVITCRKRTEQELGLSLESSYFGLHQVLSVKASSPAQQSGHMEKGDEILQVNYQTVLGWPQLNLVNLLHENANEVILTIKRRPRHATTNLLGHMYLRPKSSSTRRKHASNLISPVLEMSSDSLDNDNLLQHQDKPLVLIDNQEVVDKPQQEVIELEKEEEKDRLEVPEEEEPNKIVKTEEEECQSRFWKLYPRPRNLIKRRATVTGASPTSTRPPVTFVDDDEILTKRPPLINSKSAPEKILLLRKQGRVGNCHRNNRITLPSDWMAAADTTPQCSSVGGTGGLPPATTDSLVGVLPAVASLAAAPITGSPAGVASPVGALPATPTATASPAVPTSAPTATASPALPTGAPTATANPAATPTAIRTIEPASAADEEEVYSGQLHLRQPSNPRWTRYKCTLSSRKTLEILSSAANVKILKSIQLNDSIVSLATEVHSRPFAFKIEHDKTCYYLAAESQLEFDSWIRLINDDLVVPKQPTKRAPYKRSVSLGNSPSTRSSYLSSNTSQNKPKVVGQPTAAAEKKLSSRLPSRSSSIKTSLKSDWFNSPNTNPLVFPRLSQSTSKLNTTNISSITITTSLRKNMAEEQEQKRNKTSVGCSPIHIQQSQPMMGLQCLQKMRKKSSTSSADSPCSPPPHPADVFLANNVSIATCPSCSSSSSSKVDSSTQTESNLMLFINSQEESRV